MYNKDTESFPKIDDIIWGSDSDVFYTTTDDAHRPNKVWHYKLGTEKNFSDKQSLLDSTKKNFSDHKCIFTDNNPLFNVGVSKSDSEKYIFIGSESTETSEHWYIDLSKNNQKLNLILKRKKGITYDVEHQGSHFYMITNMDGAKNNKLMKYNISTKK